jgi:hypothetical protein
MKEESGSLTSKQCPICSQLMPLSEFGICRARKDGRNLYCKSCIRKKVTESRRALKDYKSARMRFVDQAVLEVTQCSSENDLPSSIQYGGRAVGKLSAAERVREAIRRGARTQKEIAQETKLGKDEIGDALANLLLWTREIRTEVVDNARTYSINESSDTAVLPESTRKFPRRKRDVPSSFSALQGLMPGKNRQGEPEKIGGWVAA